jgi:hypothetical protein
MIGVQWISLGARTATDPARGLLAQHLLADAAMVGTETTLGRRAAPSLVLALVARAAATAGGCAALKARAQWTHFDFA